MPSARPRAARRVLRISVAVATAALSIPMLSTAFLSSLADASFWHPNAVLPTNLTTGLVYTGLVRATPDSVCAGQWEVALTVAHDVPLCTHGPDPTPAAGNERTVAEDHGDNEDPPPPPPPTTTTTAPPPTTTSTTAPPPTTDTTAPPPPTDTTTPPETPPPPPPPPGGTFCYGDGVSGKRVQVLYAHASDVPDRLAQYAGGIQTVAVNTDAVFNKSAAETGGERHLRFVVDANCNVVVQDVVMPPAADDTFGATVDELIRQGFNHNDRKYLVVTDASVYCGIGSVAGDDRMWSTNTNNNVAEWARIDRGCWSGGVAAHELMHNLGGVQTTAPHSSGAYHCYESSDTMCYDDGGSWFANGGKMVKNCPNREWLFDCNHDDYFTTVATPTGYLANHWNAANSGWLETQRGTTTSPGPDLAPPPVSTQPPLKQSWNGSASPLGPMTYTVDSGAGTVTATLQSSQSLTVQIQLRDGTVLASHTGTGTQTITAPVPRGAVVFSVSKGLFTNFTLTGEYPAT